MTAVHIQRQADYAVGEAMRRPQAEITLDEFASIALRADGSVRVSVFNAKGRPVVAERGMDLEDCLDAVTTTLMAGRQGADPIVTVEGEWPGMYFAHCNECGVNVAAKD